MHKTATTRRAKAAIPCATYTHKSSKEGLELEFNALDGAGCGPDVVQAILRDRHPPERTAKRLSLHTTRPNAWQDQIASLGIA